MIILEKKIVIVNGYIDNYKLKELIKKGALEFKVYNNKIKH